MPVVTELRPSACACSGTLETYEERAARHRHRCEFPALGPGLSYVRVRFTGRVSEFGAGLLPSGGRRVRGEALCRRRVYGQCAAAADDQSHKDQDDVLSHALTISAAQVLLPDERVRFVARARTTQRPAAEQADVANGYPANSWGLSESVRARESESEHWPK